MYSQNDLSKRTSYMSFDIELRAVFNLLCKTHPIRRNVCLINKGTVRHHIYFRLSVRQHVDFVDSLHSYTLLLEVPISGYFGRYLR